MIRLPGAALVMMCSLGMSGAYAQITISPSSPKAFENIRVIIPTDGLGKDKNGLGDTFQPAQTQVSMSGNKITVSPLMKGNTFELSRTIAMDQTIGHLPAGDYQVEVVKRGEGSGSSGLLGSIAFSVAERAATTPYVDYTDLWWVPSESGWGLGLFHHPSNQIFGTLFVYGPDGKPTWYVIPGGQFTTPTEFHGAIYRTTGPYFGGAFNPSLVVPVAAGSATLIFDPLDSTKAGVLLVIDGVTINKDIERQPF